MTKIVHLTTVHQASDVRILHKECVSLAAAGHDVALVAPGSPGAATPPGVQIIPLPLEIRRPRRVCLGFWRAVRAVLTQRTAICHFHDPELIPVGFVLKLCGVRIVYDVHEDLPRQIRYKDYLHPWLRSGLGGLAGLVERLAATAFDGVVAATPTIAARFPAKKTVIVYNYPLMGEFAPPSDYAARSPHLAYVGGLTALRGIREMVAAMALVPEHFGTRLRLGGVFYPPGLEAEIRAMPGADRVDCLGFLERSEVAALLGDVRLGLVVLHPSENYRVSYPVKLFEYMAAGIPVVASDFPLWREIVAGAGCGLLVDPTDPAAIARAVTRLLENPAEAEAMGQRGRKAVAARYNWSIEAESLLALYRRLGA